LITKNDLIGDGQSTVSLFNINIITKYPIILYDIVVLSRYFVKRQEHGAGNLNMCLESMPNIVQTEAHSARSVIGQHRPEIISLIGGPDMHDLSVFGDDLFLFLPGPWSESEVVALSDNLTISVIVFCMLS